jgi:hypothetical protein
MDTGNNGLSKVMKSIKENVETNTEKFKFITVAGDNYYPEKEIIDGEKIKTLIEDNLISGFNCLKSIPLQKYVILGNHELDKSIEKKISEGKKNANKEPPVECIVIEKELENIDDSITFFKDVMFIEDATTSSIIIMIDTTIYESESDQDVGCYNELDFGKDIEKMGKLQEKQKTTVLGILDTHKHKKNIILIGHHPIISTKSKTKEGKTKLQVDYLLKFIEMINELVTTYIAEDKKKLYYLCADTHLYQKGNITFSNATVIEQHIVGTGGADLDEVNSTNDLPINAKDEISKFIKSYKIDENIKTNGYLECNLSSDGLTTNFINVGTDGAAVANVTGGSRKNNIRHKKIKTKKNKSTTRNKKSTLKKNKSKNKY